jgi:hypothetical protein
LLYIRKSPIVYVGKSFYQEPDMVHLERRKFVRKLVREKVIYSFGNIFYSGRLSNVSGEGMFIETAYCFPVYATLMLMMKKDENFINLIVKVKRLVRNRGSYKGIGVQLMNSPGSYLKFVDNLELAHQS